MIGGGFVIVVQQGGRRRIGQEIGAKDLAGADVGGEQSARQDIVETHIESALDGFGEVGLSEWVDRRREGEAGGGADQALNGLAAGVTIGLGAQNVFVHVAGKHIGVQGVGGEISSDEKVRNRTGLGGAFIGIGLRT